MWTIFVPNVSFFVNGYFYTVNVSESLNYFLPGKRWISISQERIPKSCDKFLMKMECVNAQLRLKKVFCQNAENVRCVLQVFKHANSDKKRRASLNSYPSSPKPFMIFIFRIFLAFTFIHLSKYLSLSVIFYSVPSSTCFLVNLH